MVGLLDSVGDILSWLLLVVFVLVYLDSESVVGQNFMVARLTDSSGHGGKTGEWAERG